MNAEYVNPFLKASIEVLRMAAQIVLNISKPFLSDSPNATESLNIVVGITGEIRGQAVISMSTDMAKIIASNMMMGMPVLEIDEMAQSALSELGNMIMGNSATLFCNSGINIDITTPTLVLGEYSSNLSGQTTTITVPLEGPQGHININISMKD